MNEDQISMIVLAGCKSAEAKALTTKLCQLDNDNYKHRGVRSKFWKSQVIETERKLIDLECAPIVNELKVLRFCGGKYND
ncbi:hypothetical protein [Photobacterium leiognathi]|uniref:hypothetical protein n=1 Tax=Photobacterium leiognathi TaxID=553611 RepID=UPI002980F9B7|nr:hypothetical protein [Photobacterium leiognathi]